MKKIILPILFLFPFFTFAATNPFHGTRTIGSGGYYPDIATAIADLYPADPLVDAIDGPVEFLILDGSYDETINLIGEIRGSSAVNTVTFRSADGDASLVEITSSTASQIVYITSAKHLVFEFLTFTANNLGKVIFAPKTDGYITFNKNVFNGSANLGSLDQYIIGLAADSSGYINNVSITSNTFINGDDGIIINSLNPGQALNISNNTFTTKGRAIVINHFDAPQIVENIITNNSSKYAISLEYCHNSFVVEKNKINTTTDDGDGIKLINSNGTSSPRGIIVNNFIQTGTKGLLIESSSSIDIFFNSISISNSPNTSSTNSSAFESLNGSTNDLILYNNMFNNKRGGYAYIGSPSQFANSNYNNLYTSGDYLFVWDNIEYKTLPLFQTNSGSSTEALSKSVEVVFASDSDMHIIYTPEMLYGKATSVIDDIDGDPRIPIPFMGADEFLGSPLNGIYTVGVGSHFTTIGLAITYMYQYGISGAVTFSILNGTYNEQIDFYLAITGSSTTNTVTFTSNSGNAADVVITNNPSNYILNIDVAEYLVFSNLTFTATNLGRVLKSFSSLNHLTFTDNIFNGSANIDTGIPTNQDIIFAIGTIDNVVFSNNNFNDGYSGLGLYHNSGSLGTFLDISDNTFSTNGSAIGLTFFDEPNVENNLITNNGDFYAIALENIFNEFVIIGNKISTTTNTGSGIYLKSITGTSSKRGRVLNNFIQASNKGIFIQNATYFDIIHNSINIENQTLTNDVSSTAFEGVTSYSNARIENNIFANKRSGYSYIGISGTNNVSNYNDLYTTGTNLGKWNSVDQSTLVDYISASSTNISSVSANPFYLSLSDLHANSPQIDDEGGVVLGFPDIDGQPRSVTSPSIGADEFSATVLPLSGTYTIGSGGDYTTIANAVAELYLKGIGGYVTFQIFTGTYNEQINLDGAITGSSTANTVTFQSNSGNASDVEITHSATGTVDNFVTRINAAEYLKFKNLTLTALGTDYAKVVSLENVTGNLEFYGNILNGNIHVSGGSFLEQSIIVCNASGRLNNTTLKNNEINGGYNGIYFFLDGTPPPTTSNLKIIENTISSKYSTISITSTDAIIISSNILENDFNSCIYLQFCDNNFIIEKNIISGSSGIGLSLCDGTTLKHGTIKNNFINVSIRGINLARAKYVDVYFNSVSVQASTDHLTSSALVIHNSGFPYSNFLTIKNNILTNTRKGYSFSWLEGDITECDYNNLYTNGTNLVKHGSTDYTTLADWQAATASDPVPFATNSKNATVTFASPTDLHIVSTSVPLNGIQITGITTDIDGDTRSNPPFMGADEPILNGVSLSITILMEGPYNSPNMNASLTVPVLSPYGDGKSVVSIPSIPGNEVVDWVWVELRDAGNSATVVESQSAFVLQDGSVVDIDGSSSLQFGSPEGIANTYYIAVKHRNHLAVMSNQAVVFPN